MSASVGGPAAENRAHQDLPGGLFMQAVPPSTFSGFVKRGIAAGAAGGVLSALYLLLVMEGPIREALAIEDARAGDAAHDHDAIFGRTTQIIGGMTAGLIYGLVAGLVFAVVFVKLRHRLWGRDDFVRSLTLAGLGFGIIVLIPGLKYPANPPGVGDAETVNARTVSYLALMVLGLVLVVLARNVALWLRDRGVMPNISLVVASVVFVASLSVAWVFWPAGDSIPGDVPADLIWRFRVLSLAGLALQWSVIGTAFGLLTTIGLSSRRGSTGTPSTAR